MAFGGETAESYYDEGFTASMKGDLDLAIRHFEQALRLDSSLVAAEHQLGKCYLRLGLPQKAAELFHKVASLKPGMIAARLDLGYALLDMNEPGKARRIFEEISASRPDNARATLGLAYCAFQEGQWDAAALLAQTSIEQGGANFAAFFLLGRAAKLAGDPRMVEAFKRADILMERTIETNPDQPEGYYFRGEICFAMGNCAKALKPYYEAEKRIVPGQHCSAYNEHFTRLDVLTKCGLCFQRIDRPDAARDIGRRILEADPNHKMGRILAES